MDAKALQDEVVQVAKNSAKKLPPQREFANDEAERKQVKNDVINLCQSVQRFPANQVFRDYVHMHSIAIANQSELNVIPEAWRDMKEWQKREEEWYRYRHRYNDEEYKTFQELASLVTCGLSLGWGDFLGEIAGEVNAVNARAGQFFTPYHLSKLMAQLVYSDDDFKQKRVITLCEPACGSGGTVIAFAETMVGHNRSPMHHMFATCIDVDSFCSAMAYIQLSLYGIPAVVYTGNTLSMKMISCVKTPGLYLSGLAFRSMWEGDDAVQTGKYTVENFNVVTLHTEALRAHAEFVQAIKNGVTV